METIWEQFAAKGQGAVDGLLQNAGEYLWILFSIALILLGARITLSLISHATKKVMVNQRYHRDTLQGRRLDSIMTLVRSVLRYVIYFVAIMMVLDQLGFEGVASSLLGAAGIGSLAIGFGAQNLVQDVVTGIFMMFENQFSVGDYIKTEEVEGTVEATAMRVTYLRTFQGEQVIVPNGTISRVVNCTRGGEVAEVIIATAYEADTRQVIDLIAQVAEQYGREHQDLIEEMPVVPGIDSLGESSVNIVVRCKVKSMKQWEVERGLRLAIKEEFDRRGVEFPYPRMMVGRLDETVHAAPPAPPKGGREEATIPMWASAEEEDG